MVERFNRTLAERIFKQINHEEISTHKVIRVWDHLLQPTIDQLNNEITRYTLTSKFMETPPQMLRF